MFHNKETAPENAVTMLGQAISRFDVLATILSDNGSCFVRLRCREKLKGCFGQTLLKNKMPSLNI